MYEALLQSNNRPFRATPDVKFYFPSNSIESARQTAVRATLRAEGPVLVLGGAGLGKSLLAQLLAEDLGSRFDIVSLHAAQLCSRKALLQSILFELSLPYRDMSEGELRLSILDRLVPSPETAPDGVLFIVDEAHTLPIKLLDELRLITNFTRNNQPRARLILLGSLKLEDVFAQPKLDSFNQRLAARCYLQPLTHQETLAYVGHQLAVAKVNQEQFILPESVELIFAASDGLPRLTNQLMDHALVLAAAKNSGPITPEIVEEAWADLQQLPAPWHSGEEGRTTSASVEFGTLEEFGSNEDGSRIDSSENVSGSIDPYASLVNAENENTAFVDFESSEPPPQSNAVVTDSESPSAPVASEAFDSEITIVETTEDFLAVDQDAMNTDSVDDAAKSQFNPTVNDNLTLADSAEIDTTEQAIDDATMDIESISTEPNFFAAFSAPGEDESGVVEIREMARMESRQQAEIDAAIDSQGNMVDPEYSAPVVEESSDAAEQNISPDSEAEPTFGTDVPTTELPNAEFLTPGLHSDASVDQPTDEQLLAFDVEQEQLESLAVWENDPPLGAEIGEAGGVIAPAVDREIESTDGLEVDQSTMSRLLDEEKVGDEAAAATDELQQAETQVVVSGELFGDDFEEEFAVSESVITSGTFVSSVSGGVAQPSDVDLTSEAPEQIQADAPPKPLGEANAETIEYLNALQGQEVPAVPAQLATDEPLQPIEQNAADSKLAGQDSWSVEIQSVDTEGEVALHGEIEEIVSQLNFSAFSVEPYSVEQLPDTVPSADLDSEEAEPDGGAVRYGVGDDVYLVHKPREESNQEGVITQAADFDDDRDLLVIEDDIPVVQPPAPPAKDETETTQTVSYSQLFAKLRN